MYPNQDKNKENQTMVHHHQTAANQDKENLKTSRGKWHILSGE